MPEDESPETPVKTAVVITRRQYRALREAAEADDRSMSSVVRKAIDSWFGFDGGAARYRTAEKEKVA